MRALIILIGDIVVTIALIAIGAQIQLVSHAPSWSTPIFLFPGILWIWRRVPIREIPLISLLAYVMLMTGMHYILSEVRPTWPFSADVVLLFGVLALFAIVRRAVSRQQDGQRPDSA